VYASLLEPPSRWLEALQRTLIIHQFAPRFLPLGGEFGEISVNLRGKRHFRKNGYIYRMELGSLLQRVLEGEDLDAAQAETLMDAMMQGALTPVQIAGALMTMRTRGETLQELVGFARAMRAHSVKVPIDNPDLLDTCGTGGDTLKTWNLSTATAFVVAAAGVPVAKHGNRAVSSKCGSADVLEALGVNLNLTPEQIAQGIEQVGVGFMFAPLHHPCDAPCRPCAPRTRRAHSVQPAGTADQPRERPQAAAGRVQLGVANAHRRGAGATGHGTRSGRAWDGRAGRGLADWHNGRRAPHARRYGGDF
jgi:hypothetical protein